MLRQVASAFAADAFGNAAASWTVNQMTPKPKGGIDNIASSLNSNSNDWNDSISEEDWFGQQSTAGENLFASNDDGAFTAERGMKLLNDQRITELSKFGDITNIESSKSGIDVYIESDNFSDLNAYKPNSGLIGREISWTAIGENGGSIGLLPDRNQEIQGLRDQLAQANKDLENSYDFLKISDQFIAPRDRGDLFLGSLEGSAKSQLGTFKGKYSTESGFSGSAESKTFNFGIDTKGRVSTELGDFKIKAPAFSSDAGLKIDFKINDYANVGVDGDKPLVGWTFGGKKGLDVPYLGGVNLKGEFGFNLVESAQRVIDPLAIKMDKINLKMQMRSQIEQQKQQIESLQRQMDNFTPKLKPVTIHISPPSKA